MTMTTTGILTREQRAAVFAEILSELEEVCPELCDVHHERDPGALVELYGRLDKLVAIVRGTTGDTAGSGVEQYLVQVHKRICSTCPEDPIDGWCPLRLRDICVLSAHASRIIHAIDRALAELRHLAGAPNVLDLAPRHRVEEVTRRSRQRQAR